jgi:hypothetical protein
LAVVDYLRNEMRMLGAASVGCNEPGPFSEGYLDKGTQGSLPMAFPARE